MSGGSIGSRQVGPRIAFGALIVWLGLFVGAPLAIVLKVSLSESAFAQPPYRPLFVPTLDPATWLDFLGGLGFDNYATLLTDDLYWRAAGGSLALAASSTVLLILVGYPAAFGLAQAPARWRATLLGLALLPFWTSFLVRVYAWIAILKRDGWLNEILLSTGLIREPLAILGTNAAVLVGIGYAYLPFAVLPVYAVLQGRDFRLEEAARDLGASPARVFWTVTVPLSAPGVAAGALLCFIPILGEFVIPDLLGGSDTLTLGRALWSEFFSNRDWPLAAAVAVVLVLAVLLPALLHRRLDLGRSGASR